MQPNQYFENYINNLQKDIFLLAYDSHYEIVSFITTYMKSDVRKEMDKLYSSWHNQSARRILEEAIIKSNIEIVANQTVNKDAVEWLGFFYSKWHFLTGEASKIIIRFLPALEGLKRFFTLHQLDETEAIEICKRHYNISRNNHRLYEYRNSDESKMIYDNPTYYSFLAIRMLYKLSKNQIFKKIGYIGDSQGYDFADASFSFGVKADVIFKDDKQSLAERYKKEDEDASRYSKRCHNSIYFCFVFSEKYEVDENKLLMNIKDLKTKYQSKNRQFKYLYFYMLGKLYEITPNDSLYIYSLPFSKKERMGIINEMKRYYLI